MDIDLKAAEIVNYCYNYRMNDAITEIKLLCEEYLKDKSGEYIYDLLMKAKNNFLNKLNVNDYEKARQEILNFVEDELRGFKYENLENYWGVKPEYLWN